MKLYAYSGERNKALRQYSQCAELLEGELSVKPEAETVALYETICNESFEQLNGDLPVAMSRLASAADFVGRHRELRILSDALSDAEMGEGQLIMMSGEPGIGKTRTTELFAGLAKRRGAAVLKGASFEGLRAPSYWPWIQIIRKYIELFGIDEFQRKLGAAVGDVALLIPPLKEQMGETSTPPPLPDATNLRFRAFESILELFRSSPRENALILILENLHCADESSVQLLSFIAQKIRELNILLLGTFRDIELKPGESLMGKLGELSRLPYYGQLSFGALSEKEVEQYVRRRLKRDSTSAISHAGSLPPSNSR